METLSDLRKFMNTSLTLGEIKTLCFDLSLDYENFLGETKNEKIIATIIHVHRRQLLSSLINWLAENRPNVGGDWSETSRLFNDLQRFNIADAEFEGEARLPAPFQASPPPDYFIEKQEYLNVLSVIEKNPTGMLRSSGLSGAGKTVIANQVAHTLRDKFPDGVICIRANHHDLEIDLRKTAVSFGQLEAFNQQVDDRGKIEFIRHLLAPKQALVIVDGIAESEGISHLLLEDRSYFTLITTQDRMLLKNMVPEEVSVSVFREEETVEYLSHILDHARVAAEPEATVQLHHLLGGLPLALSIVAAMLSENVEISINEYNEMLMDENSRLEGLTGGMSATNKVAASFELSYQALSEQVQTLFKSLTAFSGLSFNSQAVAAVSKTAALSVKMGLGRMARLSLTQYDKKTKRYQINPLVYSFARQKAGVDLASFQERAAAYYLDILEKKETPYYEQTLQEEWLNLSGSLGYLFQQKRWQPLCKGVASLTQFELGAMGFLERQGYWQEARLLLNHALKIGEGMVDEKRLATLRLNAAGFALLQNDREIAQRQLDLVEPFLPDLMEGNSHLWTIVQWYDLYARKVIQENPSLAVERLEHCLDWLSGKPADKVQMQMGYIYSRLIPLFGRQGRLDEAENAAVKASELLPEEPSPVLISLYNNLNIMYRLQGKLEASREAGQKALDFAEELNAVSRLPMLWNNLGLNQQLAGELTEAVTNYTRARSLAERIDDHYFYCGSTLSLGQVYLMLGDDLLATPTLERARATAKAQQFRDVEAMSLSNLVDLHLITGDVDQANTDVSAAWEIANALDMGYVLPTLLRQQAQILVLEGRLSEALIKIEAALSSLLHGQDKLEEGVVYRVKGEILSKNGRFGKANSAYRESVIILQDLNKYEWARTLLSLAAHLLTRQDTVSRSTPLLQRAQKVFIRMKTRREAERVAALLP